jgi:hypothetical protein
MEECTSGSKSFELVKIRGHNGSINDLVDVFFGVLVYDDGFRDMEGISKE